MSNLKSSFENVAEWCERHLEDQRGREIGMTFGTMLRVYGRLAALFSRLPVEQRTERIRQLNAKAEELMMQLSKRFLVAYGAIESKKQTRGADVRADQHDLRPRLTTE